MLNFFKWLSPIGGSYSVKTVTKDLINREWAAINIQIKGGTPSQLRQALMAADKCLDNALKDVESGESMGERLKNASKRYDRDLYNKIWEAHKMRNALAHEVGYEPGHQLLKNSIHALRQGIEALGVKING